MPLYNDKETLATLRCIHYSTDGLWNKTYTIALPCRWTLFWELRAETVFWRNTKGVFVVDPLVITWNYSYPLLWIKHPYFDQEISVM